MHQLIKAMTVSGMVATGFPLAEAANAQTAYTWYQLTPLNCQANVYRYSDGSVSTSLSIAVNLDGSVIYIWVPDSPLISGLYKSCTDTSGFWAWYDGPAAGWTSFYTYAGLR